MRLAGMVLLAAGVAGLGGCMTMGDEERRVLYACDRGPEITVIYAGDAARVIEAGGEFTLQREATGSGFSYISATRSIRGKGDEISYAIGRMAPTTCRARGPEPR